MAKNKKWNRSCKLFLVPVETHVNLFVLFISAYTDTDTNTKQNYYAINKIRTNYSFNM